MIFRLAVVAALAILVVLLTALWRTRRRRLGRLRSVEPPLALELTQGVRTWVVFTTPYCATCGPVTERIAMLEPASRLVVVDVVDRPDLARRHHVRTAPTVLLVDGGGVVQARLAGDVKEGALTAAAAN